MPRIRRIQSSFNAGVLDPRLAGRIDLKAYYNGAEKLDNAVCLPQGGAGRRGGTEHISTLDGNIARDTLSGTAYTTPNGGVGSNAGDNNTSTELITTTNISTTDNYVVVQYTLAAPLYVLFADVVGMKLTTNTTSQFYIEFSTDNAIWQGSATPLYLTASDTSHRRRFNITARYWRIIRKGITDLGTDKVTLDEFRLMVASGGTPEIKIIPFSFNTEQNYILVVDDENIAVYKDDLIIADIPTPYAGAETKDINWTQSADTLIITHKDYPPLKIVRNTTEEGSWSVSDLVITNIPQYDYGSGAENVWSTTRGWPMTVTFYEGRLVFGGSKSRPQGIWMSQSNDFFNFAVGTGLADEAVVGTLDTDQVNEIRNLVPGRSLEIYTSGGEFVVEVSPIIPETFAVKRQTSFGSKASVRAISIDGSTLFVQRNGQAVRESLYSFDEGSRIANSVSQLATFLINDPISMASTIGTDTTETNFIYVVNALGDVVVLNTLREQQIAAWSGPWTTGASGEFSEVAVIDQTPYFIVKRTVNAVATRRLEKLRDDRYTDASLYIASHSSATVTGLDHLEGETVRVKLGGAIQADLVVASGTITLARTPVAETLEVGLNFNPTITTMPVSDAFGDGPTLNREKRIVRCTINRFESLGIHVNGERIPDRQLDTDTFDAVPVPSDDVTEIYLNGWSKKAQITITQVDPVPMTILALDIEVSA